VAEELLARESLRGHGRYERPDRFVRASCCLFYRIPGGGLCGDCVLAHRQTVAGDGAL
jgi:ferric iron reductase protein FhuF